MAYYVTPNTIINNRYIGNCYAFGASGGFMVQQGFSEIRLNIPDILSKYDVTDAIQVQFSVKTLNTKIGIIKDASNFRVVEAWYNPHTETLGYDNLKLCACEFTNCINTENVISLGRIGNIYSDFQQTVRTYFGDPGGFASLFDGTFDFNVNSGVFDASSFIQVINSSTFSMTGSFVSDLSGEIYLDNINKTLQYVVDANLFRNRDPNIHNYGVIDGFVAGDLIFIPKGFTMTLSVDIQSEVLLPINNVGPSFLHAIRDKLNFTRGYVTRTTTWSTTNITQTTSVPLLLVLSNYTTDNFANYGKTWTISSNALSNTIVVPDLSKNWLGISISSNGKYQTTITEEGDIYVSNNFGLIRTPMFNIGYSAINKVSISFTGQYQTASNGHDIFISNNFGRNWTKTFSGGTSNIFVCISLNGEFQTLVSSGDNLYTSKNYGITWTPYDQNSEIYYSISGFPTAGIAMSYNGMYQTIVTENIYISNDYGLTWTNTTVDDFGDRNWNSISMSSDGLYQTAIENGGDIYTSSNYGQTWTFVSDPNVVDKTWKSVSSSATGQYQTILEEYGDIYTSVDYGYSWQAVNDPSLNGLNWQSVSVSSDGLYQCAIVYGGLIYMSRVLSINDKGNCVCI